MNDVRIVGLSGKGGSGKSKTLFIVANRLIASSNFKLEAYRYYGKRFKGSWETDVNNFTGFTRVRSEDFAAVFSFKDIKIGICSAGDDDAFLKSEIDVLTSDPYDCTICICACRTTGGTEDTLNSCDSIGNALILKKMYDKPRHSIVNNQDSDELLDILNMLLNQKLNSFKQFV
ncbi:hypothetical protein [Enterococcus sp. LJL90]